MLLVVATLWKTESDMVVLATKVVTIIPHGNATREKVKQLNMQLGEGGSISSTKAAVQT